MRCSASTIPAGSGCRWCRHVAPCRRPDHPAWLLSGRHVVQVIGNRPKMVGAPARGAGGAVTSAQRAGVGVGYHTDGLGLTALARAWPQSLRHWWFSAVAHLWSGRAAGCSNWAGSHHRLACKATSTIAAGVVRISSHRTWTRLDLPVRCHGAGPTAYRACPQRVAFDILRRWLVRGHGRRVYPQRDRTSKTRSWPRRRAAGRPWSGRLPTSVPSPRPTTPDVLPPSAEPRATGHITQMIDDVSSA